MPSVNEAFAGLLSNLELTSTHQGLVSTHHGAVRSYVENNMPGVKTQLIGSLQRRTRIHPRTDDNFDIDILVILGDFYNWLPPEQGISANDALSETYNAVEDSDRYQKLEPTIDHPTVTIKYSDGIHVELVPAYRDRIGHDPNGNTCQPTGRGFWVPKAGGWVHADYDHDADVIRQGNEVTDGRLIPTIKMLKAIKREHFPQMPSFHLEILASQLVPIILQHYASQGINPSHGMVLEAFFALAEDKLSSEVCFLGSNTPRVCLNLNEAAVVKDRFSAVTRAIAAVNGTRGEAAQIDGWRVIFGDTFPAT